MNRLITLCVLLSTLFFGQRCFSQSTQPVTSSTFFIQCMVNFDSEDQTKIIQNQLNSIPYVKMCRLDKKTKTAFIITKDIDQMNAEIVNAWFGEYSSKITCMYTGLYTVDKIQDFPLTICK